MIFITMIRKLWDEWEIRLFSEHTTLIGWLFNPYRKHLLRHIYGLYFNYAEQTIRNDLGWEGVILHDCSLNNANTLQILFTITYGIILAKLSPASNQCHPLSFTHKPSVNQWHCFQSFSKYTAHWNRFLEAANIKKSPSG